MQRSNVFLKLWAGAFALAMTASSWAGAASLMETERLGTLALDQPAAKLKLPPGCGQPQKDAETFWGADGLYHQHWKYPACGLEVGMSSERAKGPQQVFSLTIQAPSRLKTLRQIGIGSKATDVLKAYAQEYNPADSHEGQTIVADSIYGGVIFSIDDGRVSAIFIGAAAE